MEYVYSIKKPIGYSLSRKITGKSGSREFNNRNLFFFFIKLWLVHRDYNASISYSTGSLLNISN